MAEGQRRVTRLDEVRIQRSIPKQSNTLLRPLVTGGVGWRPGVPHILLHAGDTIPRVPFPVGYSPPEFITPMVDRGLHVPLAFLRENPDAVAADDWIVGWEPDPETGEPIEVFGSFPDWYGYHRSGEVGLPWIAPANAATLPATVQALAELDIAVVTLAPDGFQPPDLENELNYSQLIQYYNDIFFDWPEGDINWQHDPWGGGPDGGLLWWGSALAFLTGAVVDFPTRNGEPGPTGMSYGWFDDRWEVPTEDNADDFVDFLLPRILSLADDMGSSNTFDIACCIDSSGSFTGENTVVNRIFQTIIERCRDVGRDIFVGVSTFEDYSYWSGVNGTGSLDRPFTLHYPVSPVEDETDFNNMIAALQDDTGGGGGDTPESQIEAFYQIATGVGFSGQNDGIMTRSGESTVRGAPVDIIPPIFWDYDAGEVIIWYADTFNVSDVEASEIFERLVAGWPDQQGLGYMLAGGSGDVPPFGGSTIIASREPATVGERITRVWSYDNG